MIREDSPTITVPSPKKQIDVYFPLIAQDNPLVLAAWSSLQLTSHGDAFQMISRFSPKDGEVNIDKEYISPDGSPVKSISSRTSSVSFSSDKHGLSPTPEAMLLMLGASFLRPSSQSPPSRCASCVPTFSRERAGSGCFSPLEEKNACFDHPQALGFCPICLSFLPLWDFTYLSTCRHTACFDCIFQYVKIHSDDLASHRANPTGGQSLACFQFECQERVKLEAIATFLDEHLVRTMNKKLHACKNDHVLWRKKTKKRLHARSGQTLEHNMQRKKRDLLPREPPSAFVVNQARKSIFSRSTSALPTDFPLPDDDDNVVGEKEEDARKEDQEERGQNVHLHVPLNENKSKQIQVAKKTMTMIKDEEEKKKKNTQSRLSLTQKKEKDAFDFMMTSSESMFKPNNLSMEARRKNIPTFSSSASSSSPSSSSSSSAWSSMISNWMGKVTLFPSQKDRDENDMNDININTMPSIMYPYYSSSPHASTHHHHMDGQDNRRGQGTGDLVDGGEVGIMGLNQGRSPPQANRRVEFELVKNEWLHRATTKKDIVDRLERHELLLALMQMEDVRFCPFRDCQNVMIVPRHYLRLPYEVNCDECGFNFCSLCNEAWHLDMTCKEAMQERHRLDPHEKSTAKFIQSNTKRCPNCACNIAKEEGCNIIACICGTSFCWNCLCILEDDLEYQHYDQTDCELFV